MIKIIGAEGRIKNPESFLGKIRVFSEEKNVEIAVLDAEMVFGKEHLISAVQHALRAFERKKSFSNKLSTEILVYASGDNQIGNAIQKMGIKKETKKFALVVIGECNIDNMLSFLKLKRNDAVLKKNLKVLKQFGITENEINAVYRPADLILEKIALVDVRK